MRTISYLVPTLAGTALLATARNGIVDLRAEIGSGVPETTTYETADFDEIEVGGAFDVTVVIEPGPPVVEVTVDDNLIDVLDVGVADDRLHIGFKRGRYDPEVEPTATISVASPADLEVGGAARVSAGPTDGSSLDIATHGASMAEVSGQMDVVTIKANGASRIELIGRSEEVDIEASGASHVDLDEMTTGAAHLDASGASVVAIAQAAQVDGSLSGASGLRAPSDATGSIAVSTASWVERS